MLTLTESEKVERGQLSKSLTKKLEYYNFLPQQVKKRWNGIISYFHQDKYVPSGLWMELSDIAKKYNFPIEIEGLRNLFYDIDGQEFKEYVNKKFEGSSMPPRDYQIESAYKILKHRLCISELATSAGKSLIVFIVFSYLLDNKINKRCLMIVPTINLVIQAFEDFHEYNNGLKEENKTKLEIKQIHGGESKDFTMAQNIFVGTFQSLILFPDTFLTAFDVVCVDETHRAKAKTIQDIIGKCINANRKFGLTGTVPKKGTLDWLTLQAYLGPLVTEIKAKDKS
jgi:superfamily II DNA or RNA helicase